MVKKTILIVDDERLILEAVREILEKKYNAITSPNGEEALKKLAEQKVDLVLIDILMPKMDGFALAKKIRTDRKLKDLKLAFLTVLSLSEKQREIVKELNISDYIQKPFETEDLKIRIAKLVNGKEN